LRSARLAAGLGLRSFATLLELRPSDVSAVEWGARTPLRDPLVRAAVERLVGLSLDWSTDADAPSSGPLPTAARLACWRPTPRGADADPPAVGDLAAALDARPPAEAPAPVPRRAPLAIEWAADRLLRRSAAEFAALDAETCLELADVKIKVTAGLVPRWSVAACLLVDADDRPTVVVDRVYADAKPLASYRWTLATTVAPWFLAPGQPAQQPPLAQSARAPAWQGAAIGPACEQFALALLLPADRVQQAAAAAFVAARTQRPESDVAALFRHVAIRLAEQFAAPLELMVRRLRGWPCLLPARLHAALAAGADELPAPHEWPGAGGRRQLRLFDSV
jgi:hypothetical protein